MIKLNKNQILIKSFSYKEEITKTKKRIQKRLKGFSLEEIHEDINEVEEIVHTHAIIYLIDQNRFWYYNYVGDDINEKHHTKNGLYQSIKIIEDMEERFLTLNDTVELSSYSIFSDPKNEELLNLIEDYTNLEIK